jgi:hypothetical protein
MNYVQINHEQRIGINNTIFSPFKLGVDIVIYY